MEDLEFEKFDFRDEGYEGFVAVSSDEYPEALAEEAVEPAGRRERPQKASAPALLPGCSRPSLSS